VSTNSAPIPSITTAPTTSYSPNPFLPSYTSHVHVPMFAMPKTSTPVPALTTAPTSVVGSATANTNSIITAHKNVTIHLDSPSSPPKFQSSIMKSSPLLTTAANSQLPYSAPANFSFLNSVQTGASSLFGSPNTSGSINKLPVPGTPILNNTNATMAKPLFPTGPSKQTSTQQSDSMRLWVIVHPWDLVLIVFFIQVSRFR